MSSIAARHPIVSASEMLSPQNNIPHAPPSSPPSRKRDYLAVPQSTPSASPSNYTSNRVRRHSCSNFTPRDVQPTSPAAPTSRSRSRAPSVSEKPRFSLNFTSDRQTDGAPKGPSGSPPRKQHTRNISSPSSFPKAQSPSLCPNPSTVPGALRATETSTNFISNTKTSHTSTTWKIESCNHLPLEIKFVSQFAIEITAAGSITILPQSAAVDVVVDPLQSSLNLESQAVDTLPPPLIPLVCREDEISAEELDAQLTHLVMAAFPEDHAGAFSVAVTTDQSSTPPYQAAPLNTDTSPHSEHSTPSNIHQATPPPPRTVQDHTASLRKFIHDKSLDKFYPAKAEDQFIQNLAAQAATRVANFESKMKRYSTPAILSTNQHIEHDWSSTFTPELGEKLTKLALYDLVVLCDDSGSMHIGNSIPALKSTLKRVTEIATAFDGSPSSAEGMSAELNSTGGWSGPRGLSLRFLNDPNDSALDNIKTVEEVERIINRLPFEGGTMLGRMLRSKIVKPMVMQEGHFVRPLLVVIITDGDPQGESRNELKRTILKCKKFVEANGYGARSVVFHICQVGDNEGAEAFLSSLQADTEVGETGYVYVTREKVKEASSLRSEEKELAEDVAYNLWWVKELSRAIEA